MIPEADVEPSFLYFTAGDHASGLMASDRHGWCVDFPAPPMPASTH